MFGESNTPWQYAMGFSAAPFVPEGPHANAWQPAWDEKRSSQPATGAPTMASGEATADYSTAGTTAMDQQND